MERLRYVPRMILLPALLAVAALLVLALARADRISNALSRGSALAAEAS